MGSDAASASAGLGSAIRTPASAENTGATAAHNAGESDGVSAAIKEATCRVCTDFKSWTRARRREKPGADATAQSAPTSSAKSVSKGQAHADHDSDAAHGAAGKSSGGSRASAALGAATAASAAAAALSSSAGDAGTHASAGAEYPPVRDDCPVDSVELGRATWTFLHTMAAYYPEAPSAEQQTEMGVFVRGLSRFYPCDYCASHLRERLKIDPPQTHSRAAFARWMCGIHNEVNERLGKPAFDCDRVDERWRDGWKDGSCEGP